MSRVSTKNQLNSGENVEHTSRLLKVGVQRFMTAWPHA